MEKEVFPRSFLAEEYPEFAEQFIAGDILILEDGPKRIIRFPNTSLNGFPPALSFMTKILSRFYPEYKEDQIRVSGCLPVGFEIRIDTTPSQ